MSGLSIWGGEDGEGLISGVFIIAFLVFAGFMLVRISKHKKKLK